MFQDLCEDNMFKYNEFQIDTLPMFQIKNICHACVK